MLSPLPKGRIIILSRMNDQKAQWWDRSLGNVDFNVISGKNHRGEVMK